MNHEKIAVIWISLTVLLNLIMIVVDVAPPVRGNMIYVGGTEPGNFTSIQDGINAANPGDTVFVYNGTYYENVVVNRTINLTGENKDSTIINGAWNGDVISIVVDWVNITGFTLINSEISLDAAGVQIESHNNTIRDNKVTNNSNGIRLFLSTKNKLVNNNIFDNSETGILLEMSSNNTITGNNVSNNDYGIEMEYSSNNSISSNLVTSNSLSGIDLGVLSIDNKISGNYISSNNAYGIYSSYSFNDTIKNNSVSNNGNGIYLSSSSQYNITENTIINNGVVLRGNELSHYNTHTILDDNMVNGKPLYYFKDQCGLDIDGVSLGELILANCSSFNVKNLNINNTDVGIELAFSTFINISNNNISPNNKDGISLLFSSNNYLIRNNVSSNNGYGIFLSALSNNNTISDNSVMRNGLGISLRGSSNNNTIVENNITWNNVHGISLRLSENNTITSNNISNNNRGISLDESNRTTIDANIIFNNSYGIYSVSFDFPSMWNNVTFNYICSNKAYGLYIYNSINNTFYRNDIFHNNFYLRSSSHNIINYNNISDEIEGLWLSFLSNNNTISDNRISNTESAIFIDSSPYNTILRNKIWDNAHGIHIYYSDNNHVYENDAFLNTNEGIKLHSSSNNSIYNNNMWSNFRGIYITDGANDNIFHHNNIINNSNQVYLINSFDNIWDDSVGEGNYWSDYNGIDDGSNSRTAGDGVGDTEIPHPNMDKGNGYYQLDNYPLTNIYGNYTYLYQDWNLISIPLLQSIKKLDTVLSSINGSYDAIQWYNISDISDHWKHHHASKPLHLNDLVEIDHLNGYWIHITEPGGILFKYSGIKPTQNQTITFYPGWNLVGYPSLTSYNRTEGLNNLTFDDQVDAIWSYDASTQKWEEMGESGYFQIGKGYYIHAKSECEWEVPL